MKTNLVPSDRIGIAGDVEPARGRQSFDGARARE